MSRPPHDSEVPRRQAEGEEALPTSPEAPARQHVPKREQSTGMALGREIAAARREEAERDERQADKALNAVDQANARALAAVERQATLWFRLSMALIVVLLVLVAGVVGVGVSGTIPGVGEIKVTQPPSSEVSNGSP